MPGTKDPNLILAVAAGVFVASYVMNAMRDNAGISSVIDGFDG